MYSEFWFSSEVSGLQEANTLKGSGGGVCRTSVRAGLILKKIASKLFV